VTNVSVVCVIEFPVCECKGLARSLKCFARQSNPPVATAEPGASHVDYEDRLCVGSHIVIAVRRDEALT
jgi:hypothetical protein